MEYKYSSDHYETPVRSEMNPHSLSAYYAKKSGHDQGVILECVMDPITKRLRVRTTSDMWQFVQSRWVKFPRDMRKKGARYYVENLQLVNDKYYDTVGEIIVLKPSPKPVKKPAPLKITEVDMPVEAEVPVATPKINLAPKVKAAKPVLKEKPMAQQEEKKATGDLDLIGSGGRLADIGYGMQQGVMEGAMDGMLNLFSGPVMDALAPKFESFGPNAELAKKGATLALQFIMALGIAEATELLGPKIGGLLPGDKTKESAYRSKVIAVWMRRYAGKKFGSEVVKAAIDFLPVILNLFSQFSNKQFEDAVKEPVSEEEIRAVEEEAAVPA